MNTINNSNYSAIDGITLNNGSYGSTLTNQLGNAIVTTSANVNKNTKTYNLVAVPSISQSQVANLTDRLSAFDQINNNVNSRLGLDENNIDIALAYVQEIDTLQQQENSTQNALTRDEVINTAKSVYGYAKSGYNALKQLNPTDGSRTYQQLTDDVSELDTSVSQAVENLSDLTNTVNTNTSNIAQNTSNIGTNASNIAANTLATTAVTATAATLTDSVGDVSGLTGALTSGGSNIISKASSTGLHGLASFLGAIFGVKKKSKTTQNSDGSISTSYYLDGSNDLDQLYSDFYNMLLQGDITSTVITNDIIQTTLNSIIINNTSGNQEFRDNFMNTSHNFTISSTNLNNNQTNLILSNYNGSNLNLNINAVSQTCNLNFNSSSGNSYSIFSYNSQTGVNFGNNQLKNIADPTSSQDAVSLNYLQNNYSNNTNTATLFTDSKNGLVKSIGVGKNNSNYYIGGDNNAYLIPIAFSTTNSGLVNPINSTITQNYILQADNTWQLYSPFSPATSSSDSNNNATIPILQKNANPSEYQLSGSGWSPKYRYLALNGQSNATISTSQIDMCDILLIQNNNSTLNLTLANPSSIFGKKLDIINITTTNTLIITYQSNLTTTIQPGRNKQFSWDTSSKLWTIGNDILPFSSTLSGIVNSSGNYNSNLYYLAGNNSWQPVISYSNFTTTQSGLVPAPGSTYSTNYSFINGNALWTTLLNYNGASSTVNGSGYSLVPSLPSSASYDDFVFRGSGWNYQYKLLSISNQTSSIALPQTAIDQYNTIVINQITSSISFTLPNPTVVSQGKYLAIINIGTAKFSITNTSTATVIYPNYYKLFIYSGNIWVLSNYEQFFSLSSLSNGIVNSPTSSNTQYDVLYSNNTFGPKNKLYSYPAQTGNWSFSQGSIDGYENIVLNNNGSYTATLISPSYLTGKKLTISNSINYITIISGLSNNQTFSIQPNSNAIFEFDGLNWQPPTLVQIFTGATSSAAGSNGLVPAPTSGQQNDYLAGNGSWSAFPTSSYTNFTGATGSVAGSNGLVPAPTSGQQNNLLYGDGTFNYKNKKLSIVNQTANLSLTAATYLDPYDSLWITQTTASIVYTLTNPTVGTNSSKIITFFNTGSVPFTLSALYSGSLIVQANYYTKVEWNGNNWTISYPPQIFTGATSSTAGSSGLVPIPTPGQQAYYLAGSGSWTALPTKSVYQVTISSSYSLGSASYTGYINFGGTVYCNIGSAISTSGNYFVLQPGYNYKITCGLCVNFTSPSGNVVYYIMNQTANTEISPPTSCNALTFTSNVGYNGSVVAYLPSSTSTYSIGVYVSCTATSAITSYSYITIETI